MPPTSDAENDWLQWGKGISDGRPNSDQALRAKRRSRNDRAVREVSSKDYLPAQIEAWAKVEDRSLWAKRRISRPGWIAEIDGVPVGFSDLTEDGCLDMMFVHPEFQGLGIASHLLSRVEKEALNLGFTRIYTEASRTARPFFERRGFRVITRQTVEKRGQSLENFRMEKLYTE